MNTPIDVSALRVAEFPVTEHAVYLNHAAIGPLPRRTATALTGLVEDFSTRGVMAESRWVPVIERTRDLVGQLLNVPPSDIAFVKNTSEGLGIMAAGLAWQPGDVIVTAQGEFPANVYPWLGLKDQGVHTELVPLRNGAIDPAAIAAALDQAGQHARMVCLSWVQYHTGARCDLAEIGALCRDRGVLFGIDAIQGVGAWPLDLAATPVDFCAFGCQKWLLSPMGSGILYVNPATRAAMRPVNLGWLAFDWGDFTKFDYDRTIKDEAARFEEGTRVLLAIAGLEQSTALLLELGLANVAEQLVEMTDLLLDGLRELDAELLTPTDPRLRSGIVSFRLPGQDSAAVFAALTEARIITSLRGGYIRVAPHVYTSRAEIHLLLDALRT